MATDPPPNHAATTTRAALLRPIAPALPPPTPTHHVMYNNNNNNTVPMIRSPLRPPYPHNFPSPPPPPPIKQLLPSTPDLRCFSALVAPPSSAPDANGIRDKARDDSQFLIQDRKVRITDGASLYVLCRSWLRNGTPEETQTRYGDVARSLPKPSPIPIASVTPSKKEEGDKKEEHEDKDEESLENVSPEDLLKRHVKRARKVRARLREERLQRIARYKSRLALLLPPPVEQFRNDLAAGN